MKCQVCSHSWELEKDDKEPFRCHNCGWDTLMKKYVPFSYKEFYQGLTETYQTHNFKFSQADADQLYNNTPMGGEKVDTRLKKISDLIEANKPTNPGLWAKAKSAARSKFKVYPSAYANLWAAKKYKSMGGGWKKGKK